MQCHAPRGPTKSHGCRAYVRSWLGECGCLDQMLLTEPQRRSVNIRKFTYMSSGASQWHSGVSTLYTRQMYSVRGGDLEPIAFSKTAGQDDLIVKSHYPKKSHA